MAQIIDGKYISQQILDKLAQDVCAKDKKPSLTVIIVGEDPASKIYVNLKKKKAAQLGFDSNVIEMPENTTQEQLLNTIESLNNDVSVNAVLVQLPLPDP